MLAKMCRDTTDTVVVPHKDENISISYHYITLGHMTKGLYILIEGHLLNYVHYALFTMARNSLDVRQQMKE